MRQLGMAVCATVALLFSPAFTFKIGNSVASGDFQFKSAAFVFRTEGCADPAKPEISATAEGLVKGARKSLDLKVATTSKPNIYAVPQTWPTEGDWVVNLKGTCGNESAGAIVPFGPRGFIRESTKIFSRPATNAEIDASLKALSQGGKK